MVIVLAEVSGESMGSRNLNVKEFISRTVANQGCLATYSFVLLGNFFLHINKQLSLLFAYKKFKTHFTFMLLQPISFFFLLPRMFAKQPDFSRNV